MLQLGTVLTVSVPELQDQAFKEGPASCPEPRGKAVSRSCYFQDWQRHGNGGCRLISSRMLRAIHAGMCSVVYATKCHRKEPQRLCHSPAEPGVHGQGKKRAPCCNGIFHGKGNDTPNDLMSALKKIIWGLVSLFTYSVPVV